MSTHQKPILTLGTVAILSILLAVPAVRAQSVLVDQGTSALGNAFLTATGPEALTVSWFVVENTASDIYTYAYNVNNPVGDVQLGNNNQPVVPSTPETFDSFSLTFNATLPGAYVSGTVPIGGTFVNNGANGLSWTFPAVSPGTSSELLAFQSALPPGLGNASVGGGATPPSPWSTVPAGQEVAVPRAIPEPGITSLFALTALLLLPFSATWRRLVNKSLDSTRYF